MQKRRLLIFISKTICRIEKFPIRKRFPKRKRSIDYRESTVQFKRRVPLFDPGIELVSQVEEKENIDD